MGNVVGSAFTGISEVIGKLLGHPLDFLAGKYCSNCGPTWDLACYIEHFCISRLLKLGLVVVLLYFVLLFFYLTYKLGIFQCICHTFCRSIWACCAIYFSTIECCCTFLCSKLDNHNRRRRRKRRRPIDVEEAVVAISSDEYDDDDDDDRDDEPPSPEHISIIKRRKLQSDRARVSRKEQGLRRALRPKSHRLQVVGVREKSIGSKRRFKHPKKSHHEHHHVDPIDHVRVTRTSKFAQKRGSFKGSFQHKMKPIST